ncbi:MAG: NosD domain-containing protein [Thermoplasmata archaeon]
MRDPINEGNVKSICLAVFLILLSSNILSASGEVIPHSSTDEHAEVNLDLDPISDRLVEYDPIRINNDIDFQNTVDQEGWKGNGTAWDPWVIESLKIDGTDEGCGLYIGNTTGHFVVKDSVFTNGSGRYWKPYFMRTGVVIFNSTNGDLINVTSVFNDRYGSYIDDCSYVNISEGYFAYNERGLMIASSVKTDVTKNHVYSCKYGVYLDSSDENSMVNNTFESINSTGIFLTGSSNNTITNNVCIGCGNHAVYMKYASEGNVISMNRIHECDNYGIYIDTSEQNDVVGNNITEVKSASIFVNNIHGSNISDNKISDSGEIKISSCTSCSLYNNVMESEGVMIKGDMMKHWSSHHVGDNNRVRGSELLFLKNQSSHVGGTFGQVVLVNCSNMIFDDNNISEISMGFSAVYSDNITVRNCSFTNNYQHGIYLKRTNNSRFINNHLRNNSNGGFVMEGCVNISIENNTMIFDSITISGDERHFWNSHHINLNHVNGLPVLYMVGEKDLSIDTEFGQVLGVDCSNISLSNQIINNSDAGVQFAFCEDIRVADSIISNTIDGVSFYNCSGSIENNIIHKNRDGLYISSGSSNDVRLNNISHNSNSGIRIKDSENCTISENNITSNGYNGIFLQSSSNNTIEYNNIIHNDFRGIFIYPGDSSSNLVYNNNFQANTVHAWNTGSDNGWNLSYGTNGNYWHDYQGVDIYSGKNQDIDGKDGIGDWSYNFTSSSKDFYPLMHRLVWWKDVEPDIELISHENDSYFRPGVKIQFDIWDENYDLIDASYSINNTAFQNFSSNYSIDTTGWDDGGYDVDVMASDSGGRTRAESYRFYIDTAPPSLNITRPGQNSLISRKNVTAYWVAQDELDPSLRYEVYMDDDTWIFTELNHTTLYDLSEGNHSLVVKAFDEAGNWAESKISFIVDTVKPYVSVDPIYDGMSSNDKDFYLNWVGGDNGSGLHRYEIDLDGKGWIDIGLDTEYVFHNISDGEHRIDVRALDKAGNTASDSIDFFIDTEKPDIEIVFPLQSSYINNKTLELRWRKGENVSDVDGYNVTLDDELISTTDLTYLNISSISEGEHHVNITVFDKSGNSNYSCITFTVERTPPEINILSPADELVTDDNNISVIWEGTDSASGIMNYSIRLDDGEWIRLGKESIYNFSEVEDGEHRIALWATDRAGNHNSASIGITVDQGLPEIVCLSPTANSYLSERDVEVVWNAEDDVSGVSRVKLKLDQGRSVTYSEITGSGTHSFNQLSEGEHRLKITCLDKANNSKSVCINFSIDVSDPWISLLYPKNGGIYDSGQIRARWEGGDKVTDIDHYEIKMDNGSWIDKSKNLQHTFKNLSEEEHVVWIKAVDLAGNLRTDYAYFTVDISDDFDGDGLADHLDNDIDGDGMPNLWEEKYGLDPYDPGDAGLDLDGDGLTNLEEYNKGTDPNDDDTDGDGVIDGEDDYPLDSERSSSDDFLVFIAVVIVILITSAAALYFFVVRSHVIKTKGSEGSMDDDYRNNYFHR